MPQSKQSYVHIPSLAGNGGCYLEGFYLEDTKDNLQIMQK